MTEWAKPFVIANLYRTDLGRIGLTHEQIAALTDLDMLKITQHLGARYLESVFVAHLETVVNDLFLEQEQEAHGTLDTRTEETASPALLTGKRHRPTRDL